MDDNAKRSVSLRIDTSDYAKVKAIARRLRTRESDVFRFAIKVALAKLAPLYDPKIRGSHLMPVFIDWGSELLTHFNLDSGRLDAIINGDVDDGGVKVDADDIELLAMSNVPERYLLMRLREVARRNVELAGVHQMLRDYLNEKYVNGSTAAESADPMTLG